MFTLIATAATAGKSTAVAATSHVLGFVAVVAQANPFGDLAGPMCDAVDNLWLMALVVGLIVAFLGAGYGAISHLWRGDPGGLIMTAVRYGACAFLMTLLPAFILLGASDDIESFACIN